MLSKIVRLLMWLSLAALILGLMIMGGQDIEVVSMDVYHQRREIGMWMAIGGFNAFLSFMWIDDYFDNEDKIGGRS